MPAVRPWWDVLRAHAGRVLGGGVRDAELEEAVEVARRQAVHLVADVLRNLFLLMLSLLFLTACSGGN